MTFDKFKIDFLTFLNNSTVNLGRRGTKTRQVFIETVTAKLDAFMTDTIVEPVVKEASSVGPMSGSVIRIRPDDKNKALNVGKGVHAMTPDESMRADEQLNRSPFSAKLEKRGSDND